MWCTIVKLYKHRLLCFEARIYEGTARRATHECMSEGAARTWLAEQGIPFAKQPRYPASIQGGN